MMNWSMNLNILSFIKHNNMNHNERITNWINTILGEAARLGDNKGIELLNVCGAACCETSELFEGAVKIKNEYPQDSDPDKLFNAFKQQYYNTSGLTKEGNKITLVLEECTCPMVKKGINNPFLCNCTIGYTKKIFETLFDRTISINLEKSILRGDKICKQVIHIKGY